MKFTQIFDYCLDGGRGDNLISYEKRAKIESLLNSNFNNYAILPISLGYNISSGFIASGLVSPMKVRFSDLQQLYSYSKKKILARTVDNFPIRPKEIELDSSWLEDPNAATWDKVVKPFQIIEGKKITLEEVIRHEQVHAILDILSENSEEYRKDMLKILEIAVKNSKDLPANSYVRNLLSDISGYSSDVEKVRELVAFALTDKELSKALDNWAYPGSFNTISFLDRMWKSIIGFLGFTPKEGKLLRKLMNNISEYIEKDPELLERKNQNILPPLGEEPPFFSLDSFTKTTQKIVPEDLVYGNVEDRARKIWEKFYVESTVLKERSEDGKGYFKRLWNEERDTELELDENGRPTKAYENFLDRTYSRSIVKEEGSSFKYALATAEPMDAVRVKLKKYLKNDDGTYKKGSDGKPAFEYMKDDEGKEMTKWMPLVYFSESSGYGRVATPYSKFASDLVSEEDIVAFRKYEGTSRKLDRSEISEVHKKHSIYMTKEDAKYGKVYDRGSDGKMKAVMGAGKSVAREYEGKKYTTVIPDANRYASTSFSGLSNEEREGIAKYASEGTQVRVKQYWNDGEGNRREYSVWHPVARRVPGGVEIAFMNGSSKVIRDRDIEEIAFSRNEMSTQMFNRAEELDKILNTERQISEGKTAKNGLRGILTWKIEGTYTKYMRKRKEEGASKEDLEKYAEKREAVLKGLQIGDAALVEMKESDGIKRTLWASVLFSNGRVAWVARKNKETGQVSIFAASAESILNVAYDNKSMEPIIEALESRSTLSRDKSFTVKMDPKHYQIEKFDSSSPMKEASRLRPGDLVKVRQKGKTTTYVRPVLKVEDGRTYFANLRTEAKEYPVEYGEGKSFNVRLKEGYYRSSMDPSKEEIVEIGLAYEPIEGIEGSGHAVLKEKVDSISEQFTGYLNSEEVQKTSELGAKNYNAKASGGNKKYAKAPSDDAKGAYKAGEYVMVWAEDHRKGIFRPVRGSSAHYERFLKERLSENLKSLLEEAEFMDAIKLQFKGNDPFLAVVISAGDGRLHFRNKSGEPYSVSISEIGTGKDSKLVISEFLRKKKAYRKKVSTSSSTYFVPRMGRVPANGLEIVEAFNSLAVSMGLDISASAYAEGGYSQENGEVSAQHLAYEPFYSSGIIEAYADSKGLTKFAGMGKAIAHAIRNEGGAEGKMLYEENRENVDFLIESFVQSMRLNGQNVVHRDDLAMTAPQVMRMLPEKEIPSYDDLLLEQKKCLI